MQIIENRKYKEFHDGILMKIKGMILIMKILKRFMCDI